MHSGLRTYLPLEAVESHRDGSHVGNGVLTMNSVQEALSTRLEIAEWWAWSVWSTHSVYITRRMLLLVK